MILSPEQLQRAAYELLVSSTTGRYTRRVRELVSAFELTTLIAGETTPLDETVNRARELWAETLRTRGQRSEHEPELALILGALSETADPLAEDLLFQVALSTQPAAAWLAALARRLMVHRAESSLVPLGTRPRSDRDPVRFTDSYRASESLIDRTGTAGSRDSEAENELIGIRSVA